MKSSVPKRKTRIQTSEALKQYEFQSLKNMAKRATQAEHYYKSYSLPDDHSLLLKNFKKGRCPWEHSLRILNSIPIL